MQVAPVDETAGFLRALFGLGAHDAVTWHVRQPAEREGGVGWVVVCVVAPSGEEVRLEIRDSSGGGRSWISEGGLDLAYQGEAMRRTEQGTRERLLLAMGASFRARMRRSGTELRAHFAQCLKQTGSANDETIRPVMININCRYKWSRRTRDQSP